MAGVKDSVVKHSPQGQETKDKDRKGVKPYNLFWRHTPSDQKDSSQPHPPFIGVTTSQQDHPGTKPLTHKASVNTHDANGHSTYISAPVLEAPRAEIMWVWSSKSPSRVLHSRMKVNISNRSHETWSHEDDKAKALSRQCCFRKSPACHTRLHRRLKAKVASECSCKNKENT